MCAWCHSYKPPCGNWEVNPGPLQEDYQVWTAEPCLQPGRYYVSKVICYILIDHSFLLCPRVAALTWTAIPTSILASQSTQHSDLQPVIQIMLLSFKSLPWPLMLGGRPEFLTVIYSCLFYLHCLFRSNLIHLLVFWFCFVLFYWEELEDNLWELLLSFHHIGSGDQTWRRQAPSPAEPSHQSLTLFSI